MRIAVLFIMLFAFASHVHAVKFRTYSLAELTKTAEVIVVARIAVREGVVQAEVLRSLKGGPCTNIVVDSMAPRDKDRAQFSNGETVLLFLQKEENGRHLLLGYGDQGKWPKTVERWPYSSVHVVAVQRVEKAVATILDLDRTSDVDEKTNKLKSLLSSTDVFDEACALEYLDAGCEQKVRATLRADVDAVRRTSKCKYIQAIGNSTRQTNTPPNTVFDRLER